MIESRRLRQDVDVRCRLERVVDRLWILDGK